MQESSRVVVVTGVTRGLGRAMVQRFVEAGHQVAGCGRSVSRIAKLRERWPSPHAFEVVDVADADQVEGWARSVRDRLGPPDLLINNASLINRSAPLWQVSASEFDALLAVNLAGVANTIRSFLPGMIENGRGVVVNFSSGWGRVTAPQVGPYCATKWGIEGLTRSLAQELPAGLAAVALNPGIIDTEMLRSAFGSDAAAFPDAETWSSRSVPFLLELGPDDNGSSATVP